MSVEAYKAFSVTGKDGEPRLKAIYYNVVWPTDDPMIKAECNEKAYMWWGVRLPNSKQEGDEAGASHEESAPHDGCAENRVTHFGCGIYSTVTEEKAREWREKATTSFHDSPNILAKVEIWGKTVPHELGYRSEFCRVLGIIPAHEKPNRLERKLAEVYELPILEKEKVDG